jgi:hypothetical protein
MVLHRGIAAADTVALAEAEQRDSHRQLASNIDLRGETPCRWMFAVLCGSPAVRPGPDGQSRPHRGAVDGCMSASVREDHYRVLGVSGNRG